MAASNRASRLTKLVADLKKRYKPDTPKQRPLFETVLYATLVENSTHDAAEKAMAELEKAYFDWNEVRVSSRSELAERLKPLNDPTESADRLKRALQSIFESIYAFDLESLKKQNLGQAVKQISAYDGVSPFVVAYATQHGLSGHAIAVNSGVLLALQVFDIITEAEAKRKTVPGLERAIPKNKGVEAQAALHAMGVEISRNPYAPAARKLMTDIDPSCKDRLPKRPKPVEKPVEKAKPAAKEEPKKAAVSKAAASKKAATKPAAAKKAATKEKAKPAAKASAKKPAPKKTAKKTGTKKTPAKKATTKKKVKKKVKKASASKTTTKKKKVKKKVPKRKPK
ncbi:MAG: hypothetical protein AAF266_16100 [Planctomycetota bacterium]